MMTPSMGPEGHGRYGILDTGDDRLLNCHERGQPWKHIASHARAADYRARHGLAQSHALVAPADSTRMRDSWEQHRKEPLTAIQTYPGNGRGASRAEVLAGYQQRTRTRRGCRLTAKERELLGEGLDDAGMGR